MRRIYQWSSSVGHSNFLEATEHFGEKDKTLEPECLGSNTNTISVSLKKKVEERSLCLSFLIFKGKGLERCWLRALAVLTEDVGSVPGTHMAHNHPEL